MDVSSYRDATLGNEERRTVVERYHVPANCGKKERNSLLRLHIYDNKYIYYHWIWKRKSSATALSSNNLYEKQNSSI